MNIFSKSIMLMLVLALGSLCAKAQVYTDATTGLLFSLTNGNATILNSSGTTATVSTNYTESVIVIPETVTDENDTSITGTVTTLGVSAFQNCTALEEITLPSTLTTIGTEAFRGTSKLRKVHIASIESYLGIKMGNEYSSPTRVGVDKIIGLYIDGELLTDLVIPEGITETKAYSFAGNHSLKSVKLPSTLKTINTYSFFGCVYIETVDLANVVTIGNYAFSSSNTTLSCKSLKSLRIPSTCKTIGTGAFYYAVSLEELIFEPNPLLTTIGNNAFACNNGNKNTKLKTVSLPLYLTSLGSNNFAYYTALENFETNSVLPSTPTSNTSLKNVTIHSSQYVANTGIATEGVTLTVPVTLYDAYATAPEWAGCNIQCFSTKSNLKADVLDVVFNADGTATDISNLGNTIAQKGTFTINSETNEDGNLVYSQQMDRFVYQGRAKSTGNPAGYYVIDYAPSRTTNNPKAPELYTALADGFTIECYFRILTGTGGELKLIGGTQGGGWTFEMHGNKPSLLMNNGTTNVWTWCDAKTALTAGDYCHFIGTWDRDKKEMRAYVNGVLENKCPINSAATNENLHVKGSNFYWIGIGAGGLSSSGGSTISGVSVGAGADCDISILRIYDKVIDPSEANALWHEVENFTTGINCFEKNEKLQFEGAQTLTPGRYVEMMKDVNKESALYVDMKDIEMSDSFTADDLNTTAGMNANTLYNLPSGSDVVGKNIIVDEECDNLVITDNKPFFTPTAFTTTTATYTRNMPNGSTWGTICLPYEVSSNESVTYYTSGTMGDGVLNLTKAETVPAGTPAIFQTNATTLEAIGAGNVTPTLTNSTSDITLIGTYAPIKVTDANAYYIKSNKFWRRAEAADGYFTVAPFRAYFTASNTSSPSFSISVVDDDLTGLENLVGDDALEVKCYYDLSGNKYSTPQKGVNIIEFSTGKTQTVIIK